MSTPATSTVFQPPRKEKSKSGFYSADPAEPRASGAGKNWRKTKPTSSGRRRHGLSNRTPNFAAVRREEARREALKKSSGPPPKRGAVKAAIFKDVVDATRGFLCASPTSTRDADVFLDAVPFPKKSQPMAKLWPSMDAPR